MDITADRLSNISIAALVSAMVKDDIYILVVGLGLTGLSAVRYLARQKKNIVVVDSRNNPPGLTELKSEFPNIEVYLGRFDEALFMGASQIVVSPGVALKESSIQAAMEYGVDVVGDIELFALQNNAPVIAVTGSNGKSTVVSLLGEMARTAGINAVVGGNIGVPVLELLETKTDLYILELSSFQLESIRSLAPVAATVLNLSPDHMDRYNNFDEYVEAKQRIYQNCKIGIINQDDSYAEKMHQGEGVTHGFTLSEPGHGDYGLRQIEGVSWLCKGEKKLIAEQALKIKGKHNTANALAALALGEAARIPLADMLICLTRFTGLAHRTQWVAEIDNVSWINDSKGTNVGATIAAINGLSVDNKIILIAGGQAKDADFLPLLNETSGILRAVILIGQDAVKIEQALQGKVMSLFAKDMAEAVHIAADLAHPLDTVLLSPACASFDMFNGYEHRGEVFIQAVEALK